MCGGGNLGGLDAARNGNIPVVARALPVLKNLENQDQPSSKAVNTSEKDAQQPITVG